MAFMLFGSYPELFCVLVLFFLTVLNSFGAE